MKHNHGKAEPVAVAGRDAAAGTKRLDVLDGWRAISILLVLGCHLLPLGPRALCLNSTAAAMGMAIFFTLSGFLITRFLLSGPSVVEFLIRRCSRILPLAWLGLVVSLSFSGATPEDWWRNLTFTANLPPQKLLNITSHYWSLCVELQFYVGIAALYALLGRRGLYLLPVVALAVTLHRIDSATPTDIVTSRRVDEILAGATLALVLQPHWDTRIGWAMSFARPWIWLVLLFAASHPSLPMLNYARPYVASMLVGSSVVQLAFSGRRVLTSGVMAYIAAISYALYVIHQILQFTWLGTGDSKVEVYAKRLPLFVALLALAHASTFYFEKPFMDMGKRLCRRLALRPASSPVSAEK